MNLSTRCDLLIFNDITHMLNDVLKMQINVNRETESNKSKLTDLFHNIS